MKIRNASDFTLWRWFWLILADAIFMPITFTVLALMLRAVGFQITF